MGTTGYMKSKNIFLDESGREIVFPITVQITCQGNLFVTARCIINGNGEHFPGTWVCI